MREPWYKGYFSPAFWHLARAEYSEERTAKELRYLHRVLGPLHGLRVLDLGCGTGRHALALAKAGAVVTGIDIATEHAGAFASASAQATGHGASARQAVVFAKAEALAVGSDIASALATSSRPVLRFLVGDLLLDETWPDGEFDAIVCIQSLGWGSEADQRRFFRNCRRRLAAGGVFILDHSNVYQIARRFSASASCELDGVRFDFERSFDVLTGRNSGSLTATNPNSTPVRTTHDFQLYSTHALIADLQRSGFTALRVDADFEVDAPVTLDTRYAQIIATPTPRAPHSLAIHTHAAQAAASTQQPLNLMWAPDEVEWLTRSLDNVLQSQPAFLASSLRHYPLADPYGAQRSRPALESFFRTSLTDDCITFGAGITSLLRQLASLADSGTVVCSAWTYPDYAAWSAESGARVHHVAGEDSSGEELLQAAIETRATVVLIERPTVFGQSLSLAAVSRLAAELRGMGCVLLIDEAYNSYYAGFDSAASLVSEHGNLIVLRSFSKGYCCGGLRLAFALAGQEAAVRVRELVAPLQVAELSFQIGLRLLEAGDIFTNLRARTAECKRHVLRILRDLLSSHAARSSHAGAAGTAPAQNAHAARDLAAACVIEGNEELPWIVLHDPAGKVRAALNECGILVKPLTTSHTSYLRMSIPLSTARREAFDAKMEYLRATHRAR